METEKKKYFFDRFPQIENRTTKKFAPPAGKQLSSFRILSNTAFPVLLFFPGVRPIYFRRLLTFFIIPERHSQHYARSMLTLSQSKYASQRPQSYKLSSAYTRTLHLLFRHLPCFCSLSGRLFADQRIFPTVFCKERMLVGNKASLYLDMRVVGREEERRSGFLVAHHQNIPDDIFQLICHNSLLNDVSITGRYDHI